MINCRRLSQSVIGQKLQPLAAQGSPQVGQAPPPTHLQSEEQIQWRTGRTGGAGFYWTLGSTEFYWTLLDSTVDTVESSPSHLSVSAPGVSRRNRISDSDPADG